MQSGVSRLMRSSKVFLEIKKKWKGVVYKRRISLTLQEAEDYLDRGKSMVREGQIESEIDYFLQFYQPKSKMYISYDREAYFVKEDSQFRITFDKNIRSRQSNLSLSYGDEGEQLLEEGYRLMEIKVAGFYPGWLVEALSDYTHQVDRQLAMSI